MPPVSIAKIPFILDSYLAAGLLGAVIAYEGQKFDPPNNKLWLRPVCKTGDMLDNEKGKDGYSRRVGVYLVDIFAPKDGPDIADAWELAAQVEKLFRRECIDCVITEDPSIANLGLNDRDNFQLRVTVPWWCWTV
ncbi:MAG: DUF4128 domain-containing protein [Deltaproteobacteria bacterium]|jgi:hypothetical protein|nr:DUF4128 domain-containing protein [Deltaproteobacteria bacterium]